MRHLTALSALRTKITNQYPQASEASTTIQAQFLNEAYGRLWKLSGNKLTSTATTVASRLAYTLAGDFSDVGEVTWDGDPLRPMTVDEAYAYDPDWQSTTGTPLYFHLEGDILHVFPIDAVGSKTLRVVGHGVPDDMSDNTDEPDLPDGYDDALVDFACWKVAVRIKDASAQATYKAMWDEEVRRFRREVAGQTVEPEQVSDHWWHPW